VWKILSATSVLVEQTFGASVLAEGICGVVTRAQTGYFADNFTEKRVLRGRTPPWKPIALAAYPLSHDMPSQRIPIISPEQRIDPPVPPPRTVPTSPSTLSTQGLPIPLAKHPFHAEYPYSPRKAPFPRRVSLFPSQSTLSTQSIPIPLAKYP